MRVGRNERDEERDRNEQGTGTEQAGTEDYHGGYSRAEPEWYGSVDGVTQHVQSAQGKRKSRRKGMGPPGRVAWPRAPANGARQSGTSAPLAALAAMLKNGRPGRGRPDYFFFLPFFAAVPAVFLVASSSRCVGRTDFNWSSAAASFFAAVEISPWRSATASGMVSPMSFSDQVGRGQQHLILASRDLADQAERITY